jgi:DNA replication protein DnaC
MTESDTEDPWDKKMEADRRSAAFAQSGITEREGLITFKNFEAVTESQHEALAIARALAEANNQNLYLWGDRGVGKTHLALSIINEHIGKRVRFSPISRFLMEIRKESMDRSEIQALEYALGWWYFVLDDFGTQKLTEWSLMFMDCFFDEWWRQGKTGLIITSNFPLGKIAENISDRIASRIAGMCTVRQITGVDARLNARGK